MVSTIATAHSFWIPFTWCLIVGNFTSKSCFSLRWVITILHCIGLKWVSTLLNSWQFIGKNIVFFFVQAVTTGKINGQGNHVMLILGILLCVGCSEASSSYIFCKGIGSPISTLWNCLLLMHLDLLPMDMLSMNYQSWFKLWAILFVPRLINCKCLPFLTTLNVNYMVYYVILNGIILLPNCMISFLVCFHSFYAEAFIFFQLWDPYLPF